MDDKERLEILRRYNFSSGRPSIYPVNWEGFGGAKQDILFGLGDIQSITNRDESELIHRGFAQIYSGLGYMLSKYISNPTSELPDEDGKLIHDLRKLEKLTFQLAIQVDEFQLAFFRSEDVSDGSDYYQRIMKTFDEMKRVDTPMITRRLTDLEERIA